MRPRSALPLLSEASAKRAAGARAPARTSARISTSQRAARNTSKARAAMRSVVAALACVGGESGEAQVGDVVGVVRLAARELLARAPHVRETQALRDARAVLRQPLEQARLGARQHRLDIPECIIEIERDGAHGSAPLQRLPFHGAAHSRHRQQELFLLVAARLAADEARRGGVRRDPHCARPARDPRAARALRPERPRAGAAPRCSARLGLARHLRVRRRAERQGLAAGSARRAPWRARSARRCIRGSPRCARCGR